MSIFKFFTGMSITKSDFEEDERILDEEAEEYAEKRMEDMEDNYEIGDASRHKRDPSDSNY